MLESLLQKQAIPGQQYSYTKGKGHINGLIIKTPLDSEITIRLRSERGTTILANHMPAAMFVKISNMDYGFNSMYQNAVSANMNRFNDYFSAGTNPETLEKGIGQLFIDHAVVLQDLARHTSFDSTPMSTDLDNIGRDFNKTGQMLKNGFFNNIPDGGNIYRLDLGSIYLNDGDELDIDVRVNTMSSTEEGQDIVITGFSDNDEPYNVTRYTQIVDNNTTIHNADHVYMYVPDYNDERPNAEQLNGINIQTDTDDDQMLSTYLEVVHETLINSAVENFTDATQVLPLLYASKDEILDDIHVKVTGLEWGQMTFLSVENDIIEDKVEQSMIREAEKKIRKIEDLEKNDPEKADSLKNTGVIPSSKDLKGVVASAKRGLRKR